MRHAKDGRPEAWGLMFFGLLIAWACQVVQMAAECQANQMGLGDVFEFLFFMR